MHGIDLKVTHLRAEISPQARVRAENIDQIEHSLQVDFPKIQEHIIQTSIDR